MCVQKYAPLSIARYSPIQQNVLPQRIMNKLFTIQHQAAHERPKFYSLRHCVLFWPSNCEQEHAPRKGSLRLITLVKILLNRDTSISKTQLLTLANDIAHEEYGWHPVMWHHATSYAARVTANIWEGEINIRTIKILQLLEQ